MVIEKAAVAGTLESSDAQITVEPGGGKVELCLLYTSSCFFDPIDGTCSVIKLTRQYPAMHRNTSRDTAV